MTKKNLGFMFDIESLDVGPKSIVTQIAFVAFDLADPLTPIREVSEFLPIQPQIQMNRTFSADTLIWWMGQSVEARVRFNQNTGNDLDELPSLIRSVTRKFRNLVGGDDVESYQVWARGPQFDIVNIESLITDVGELVPWRYDSVMDLRTMMKLAGLKSADVEKPATLIDHVALDDCKFQILCYAEAWRKIWGAK
jgi:3' exoribonuclease, RNase T-like